MTAVSQICTTGAVDIFDPNEPSEGVSEIEWLNLWASEKLQSNSLVFTRCEFDFSNFLTL